MKKLLLMFFLVLTIVLLNVCSSVYATEYEFVENLNLSDLNVWESGVYKPKNGVAVRFSPGIRINKNLKFSHKKYNVEIVDNKYCISITEFDRENRYIKSTELKNGDVFIVDNNTSFFRLSMYSINKKGTFIIYQKLDRAGKFGLRLNPIDLPDDKVIDDEKIPDNGEDKKYVIGAKEFVDKMKIGWNLGNTLEPYYGVPNGDSRMFLETYWKNPKVTKELFEYVKSVGFDTVRIPVTWDVHSEMNSDGTIVIKKEWMERVIEVVQYALDSGLNVIINTHHEKSIYAGTNDVETNCRLFFRY